MKDLLIDVDVDGIRNLDESTAQSLLDKTVAVTSCINHLFEEYNKGMITITQYLELRKELVNGLQKSLNATVS